MKYNSAKVDSKDYFIDKSNPSATPPPVSVDLVNH